MIDVSQFTHLQAAVALLVERHGENGVRVCELCKEINAAPRAVKRVLAFLLKFKLIQKNYGEIPKYTVTAESPSVTVESPSVTTTPENKDKKRLSFVQMFENEKKKHAEQQKPIAPKIGEILDKNKNHSYIQFSIDQLNSIEDLNLNSIESIEAKTKPNPQSRLANFRPQTVKKAVMRLKGCDAMGYFPEMCQMIADDKAIPLRKIFNMIEFAEKSDVENQSAALHANIKKEIGENNAERYKELAIQQWHERRKRRHPPST